MSRKGAGKKNKALDEVLELKGRRRADIIKCAFAVTLIIVVILGKPMLEVMGVIPEGSMMASGAMFLLAIVLAAFAGSASTDFAKSGRRIEELCSKNAITKDDIRAFDHL